ncbi:MAG: hypothetical protein L3J57_16195 [Desulfuromusa sp.]|nr:hypothetical protein [Desulfuromusa sp.]
MFLSSRLYFCSRCHVQVIICSHCDRGQRYCTGECRHEARSESAQRASKKYQSTRASRFKNAARQQRFRERHSQKVTHQGSPSKHPYDLLKTRLTEVKKTPKPSFSGSTVYCHYCAAVCEPFLRLDFMRSRRITRSFQ